MPDPLPDRVSDLPAKETPPLSARFGLFGYRMATRLARPALGYLLKKRLARGKEDEARIGERRGIAGRPRPQGPLVWFHAASIGEAVSVLPLIARLMAQDPALHVLVTTGTVTSAKLLAERLPKGAFHQFIPLDHPDFCARFLDHWQPDLAVWVESEFWPNLILATRDRGIPMALVNARMSPKSFEGWSKYPKIASVILNSFSLVLAQDQETAVRLQSLGARHAISAGNLKNDAPALPAKASALASLHNLVLDRPVWLAASTHPGEEDIIAETHIAMAPDLPDLLTIIVPRHPDRGADIAAMLENRGLQANQRSRNHLPGDKTDVYIADTIGELGVFYRLTETVFIGGTLVPHGGQNPIEAARLNCAIMAGPHRFNFEEAFAALAEADALFDVNDASSLSATIKRLLGNDTLRHRRAAAARKVAEASSGVAERVAGELLPLLKQGSRLKQDEVARHA